MEQVNPTVVRISPFPLEDEGFSGLAGPWSMRG